MPTESWGDHEYYFSAAGHTLQIGYEVQVTTQNDPAEDATVSEARIYYQTGPVTPDTAPDETRSLMKNGSGILSLDLSAFDPRATSPLLLQFVFGKDFTSGPKSGTTETNDRTFCGVVLGLPDVGSIGVRKEDGGWADEWVAQAGDTVKLEVSEWGVHLFEAGGVVFQGGIPGGVSTPETSRFPSGYESDVKWFVDGQQQGTGLSLSYTVPADAAGKALKVEAYRVDDLRAGARPTAMIDVVKLEVVGLTEKGGETAAHEVIPPGTTKQGGVGSPSHGGTPAADGSR